MSPPRHRLPNRRSAVTHDIAVAGQHLTATIGFDPEGRPREVFLSAGKGGSGLSALLEDAAVMISVGLQHGVTAAALSHSIGRVPAAFDGPPTLAASAIGAALDLLCEYEV